MPSSLAGGPRFTFFTILRRLSVRKTAVLYLEPREAPATGVRGDLYVGTDGKLYVHNGTSFVVVGTQT